MQTICKLVKIKSYNFPAKFTTDHDSFPPKFDEFEFFSQPMARAAPWPTDTTLLSFSWSLAGGWPSCTLIGFDVVVRCAFDCTRLASNRQCEANFWCEWFISCLCARFNCIKRCFYLQIVENCCGLSVNDFDALAPLTSLKFTGKLCLDIGRLALVVALSQHNVHLIIVSVSYRLQACGRLKLNFNSLNLENDIHNLS